MSNVHIKFMITTFTARMVRFSQSLLMFVFFRSSPNIIHRLIKYHIDAFMLLLFFSSGSRSES